MRTPPKNVRIPRTVILASGDASYVTGYEAKGNRDTIRDLTNKLKASGFTGISRLNKGQRAEYLTTGIRPA